MNELNFAYWLQGYFELSKVNGEIKLTQDQINMIDKHLNLVFNKVTDNRIEILKKYDEGRISDKTMLSTIVPNLNKEIELTRTYFPELGKPQKEELFVQYKNQASC